MGMMKNLSIEYADEDREDLFNEERYNVEHDHRFMLYAGKYSDLQTMQLHNRQQMEIFGIIGGDFVCCRCREHGNHADGFTGEFSHRGIFLCSDCLNKINNWKDRKKF